MKEKDYRRGEKGLRIKKISDMLANSKFILIK